MNNLVFIENDRVVTDSLTVAAVFGKEHRNVLADIENQISKLNEAGETEWGVLNFQQTQYQHPQNKQWYKKYYLTEEAFTLVAFSYITPEAMKMKVKFIQEFKRMKEELQKQISQPKSQAEMLLIYAQQFVEQERKLKVLEIETQKHSSRIEQIENKIEKRMTDEFMMQLVTPTQIGKMFEPALSGKKVNKLLQKAGFQWRVGGEWVATVEGKKYSSSEPIQLPDGKMTYQLKWQRRVKDLIQSEV
ncbi:Rha family transcriptional regulator [Neobacillus sedimentimangrovi]|uniref:Rha family transcriptional regulator n=1 Tax=Neobacillus sedimentimangrovi TaxID=2699460 RepID=UPI0013D285EB|nr:Rha family transcriptional regulator [Neobacillus sedimentimangrovi]